MTLPTLATSSAIDRWFSALDEGDLEGAESLFSGSPVIRNAANPELSGPGAARTLLGDFLDRTKTRHFIVHAVATGATCSFAWWTASLCFRAGATVAGRTLKSAFAIEITGVDVFCFDKSGHIQELDIIHQTTSVAVAAVAHS